MIFLYQSSLSRLHDYIESCDVAFVSANKNKDWIYNWVKELKEKTFDELKQMELTDQLIDIIQNINMEQLKSGPFVQRWLGKINRQRTNMLLKDIKSLGYSCFKADGSYQNMKRKEIYPQDRKKYTDKEESFAIINTYHIPEFFEEMHLLGNQYSQQSILVIEAGGKNIELIYDDGTIEQKTQMKWGKDAPFKSLINGRPFVVEHLSQLIVPKIKCNSSITKRAKNISKIIIQKFKNQI